MVKLDHSYWHYFVALCNDVERTARFVEPTEDNFKTYSIEFARLILAIGSEIDVVAKLLCKAIDPNSKASRINHYLEVILTKYPDLPKVEIVIPRSDLSLTPWKEWQKGENPNWWKQYNGVKHERNENFSEANMVNMLNSLGGLLVLLGYYYADDLMDCRMAPPLNFIRFCGKYYSGSSMGERGYNTGYRLPGMPKRKRG